MAPINPTGGKEMNVNDRVVLTTAGMARWGRQSGGGEGVVISEVSATGWQRVRWDNGNANVYRDIDIELVKPVVPKVGDRVRMSAAGKARWGNDRCNPHDGEGTVSNVDSTWTQVRWDNSLINSYKEGQLELVESAQKEKKVKLTKGKEKVYVDRDGDQFEVDTITSQEYVYFTTGNSEEDGLADGQVVRLSAEDVKKIRKQLGKWLDNKLVVA
jgi:hypothetical protein